MILNILEVLLDPVVLIDLYPYQIGDNLEGLVRKVLFKDVTLVMGRVQGDNQYLEVLVGQENGIER